MAPFAEVPIVSEAAISTSAVEVSKEPDLLDGWWTCPQLFELERRAIFSKTWICIGHRSRFPAAGSYMTVTVCGFGLVLMRGKDSVVRAFHNVCRHRAHTLTSKAAGKALVLGCRYHGWSYDTRGRLVKAPQFDGLEGFAKAENGLFEVHACVDRLGFVHVNLDAGPVEYPPMYDESAIVFADRWCISADDVWMGGWEVEGAHFNWKVLGTTDCTGIGLPTPPSTTDGSSIWASPFSLSFFPSILRMFCRRSLNIETCQTLQLGTGFIILAFPGTDLWTTMTFLPSSAHSCTVKCDVFHSTTATATSITSTSTLADADLAAIKRCCQLILQSLSQQYAALAAEIPVSAPQLPLLKDHVRLERLKGRKIYPARVEKRQSEGFLKAEQLCIELDNRAENGEGRGGDLEW